MNLKFFKYQGTGNDFVIIDNRQHKFPKNDTKAIAKICDRKFGIGADGLILLEDHPELDFKMVYFNSDGKTSSMCGNGGRCITHFAKHLELIDSKTTFEAIDGPHTATITANTVALKMNDVHTIQKHDNFVFLDTGSPHHVQLVSDLAEYNVVDKGREIRLSIYGKEGANVNFVEQITKNSFKVRTYERGVENETLSCGTGVTAVALAMFDMGLVNQNRILLEQPGGKLEVSFQKNGSGYYEIYLIGPANQVFDGTYTLS